MTTKTKTTWRTVRLRDVIQNPLGGDWGKELPDPQFSEEVYAIRGTDFSALETGDFSKVKTRFIKKTSLDKRRLVEGDIVMEISGGSKGQPVGRSFIITSGLLTKAGKPLVYSNFCRRLRVSDDNDPRYLFYFLQKFYSSPEVLSFQTQSTGISNFHFTAFVEYKEIFVPRLDVQVEIGRILAAFDEKIENNNRIIKTLEEMAQAIFKKQFDVPVDDLPEGWEVKKLGELGKVVTGKTPSTKDKENFGTDYPFITIPDLQNGVFVIKTERFLSDRGANTMRASKLPAGAICVSCIATIGLVGIVTRESFTNQQINSIIPRSKILQPFIFLLLQKMKGSLQSHASGGTAAPIISKSAFEKIEIVFPTEKVLKDFYEVVNPMFDKVLAILEENQKLAATRDLLLPRLMSGKIRV
ncbi:MAG TPA: restriction endonuclease subunit S [Candidatus Paceibacterota bacterium]|nr:restriction endonuclease subunit S [Candidatus Paceibacterota bacterium]